MNQRKDVRPQAKAPNQMMKRTASGSPPHKPGVAQPKTALVSQKKQPVAPPVYRPQNPGAKHVRPGENPVQMKSSAALNAPTASRRANVVQLNCGKCGSPSHSKKNCTASADERAAYLHNRMSHGFHGKDRPKKHIAKAKAKSMASVNATVNK